MTPERKAEIKAATKDHPATLTQAEVDELRAESRHRFQADFGAGKYILPAKAVAKKMQDMKLEGKTNAEIADALGLAESSVRRIISQTY